MRILSRVVLAAAVLVASPAALARGLDAIDPNVSTAASADLSLAYNTQTDLSFRRGLQIRLAWTGDYVGSFDGQIGPASLRAIRDFQARHGMPADGVITESMLQLLIKLSDGAQSSLGVSLVDDDATGVRLVMPLSLVSDLGATQVGSLWRANDGSVEIETVRIADTGQTLGGLFEALSEPTESRSVLDVQKADGWFTVSGIEAGRHYFMRFAGDGPDLRGFSISYTDEQERTVEPYLAVASNMFEPFAASPRGPLVAEAEPDAFSSMLARQRGGGDSEARYAMVSPEEDGGRSHLFEMPRERARQAQGLAPRSDTPAFDMAGSGFVVSDDGWLLTNAHVVRGCQAVEIGDEVRASEVRFDEENDLALIHVEKKLGEPLAISTSKPRLGEDILALGFPLRSILADSLNVTRGNVSSLLGLMNDERYLQISAPVQPGNSGGPLVDLAGRVVGVVTAKLDAVAVADATGDIPQSINFAIRPDAVTAFLHANDVAFDVADEKAALESVPDATAKVKNSIYPVVCVNE